MKIKSIAALSGLTAAGLMLSPGSAQAHSGQPPNEPGVWCVSIPGADVCFESNGDDLWVRDTARDGASARANWYVSYDRSTPHCTNSHGYNTWHECTFNMREGETIYIKPQVYDVSEGRLISQADRYYPYTI